MPNKPVALVTGANQGIGLQIAKDFVPHGFTGSAWIAQFREGSDGREASARMPMPCNVFGTLSVYQAMLPLLRATPGARIVNVSSGVGSLTATSDPTYPYRAIFGPVYPASKTALNALTVAMALELESEGIKVNGARQASSRVGKTRRSHGDVVSSA